MPIRVRTVLATILLFSGAFAAHAQIPSLLPGKSIESAATNSANPPVVVDPKKELADAQSRFGETQSAINQLQTQLNQPNLTSDARNNLLKLFNQRQTLADRYAQQIGYLKQLQVINQQIADAKQQRDNWVPPAGAPPWPVTQGDLVKNQMAMQTSRIDELSREINALTDQIATYGHEKADADVRLRQLQEQLGNDPTKLTDASRQALDTARMTEAIKSSLLAKSDLEKRLKDKQRTLIEIQLSTLSKTWNYFAGRFALTPETLASAKGDLQILIDRNRDQEIIALSQSETALKRLNQLQAEYQALDQQRTPPEHLARAKADLDVAQAKEAAARSQVDQRHQLMDMGNYGLQVWDARAALYATPTPNATQLSEIAESVKVSLLRIAQARNTLNQQLSIKEQAAFAFREDLVLANDSLGREVLTAKLQAANAEADSVRSVLAALDKFEQLVKLLQSELEALSKTKTVKEQLTDYGQQTANLVKNAWNFELFSVDDLVIADGQEVKTTRSVTVGKSIGAIILLLFGYMLISRLIRSSILLAEHKIGLTPSTATQIRRWLMLISTATLIVLSFNLVQIPLSIFAFLGGALAIGVGFGAQNILKNLISGGILLIERPIKIGDLVEMDGIKGRVTSIGMRFSTIHSADGIDTLIPNSELVEKKLINWTFSNPNIRREVKVDIDYGASLAEVKQLMQSAALQHPDVMQTPPPMVVLDDLNDDALVFTLRYWIRVGPTTDGRVIDSDLRSEILERLKTSHTHRPNEGAWG